MKQEYCYNDFKYKDKSIDVDCGYFAPGKKHYGYSPEEKKLSCACYDKKWDACGKKIPCAEACCQKESCVSKKVYTKLRALYSTCTYNSCQTVRLHDLVICPCGDYKPPFCVKCVALGDCDAYKVSDWKVIHSECCKDKGDKGKDKDKGKADILFTLHAPIQLDVEDACGCCFTVTGIAFIPLCLNMHVPHEMKPCDFEILPCLKCATATLPCLTEACVTGQFEICANTFHERLVCLQPAECGDACPSVPVHYCDCDHD